MEYIYGIIHINDLLKVDFTQVGQTSANTLEVFGLNMFEEWETEPTL
jgi:hypothetical protein